MAVGLILYFLLSYLILIEYKHIYIGLRARARNVSKNDRMKPHQQTRSKPMERRNHETTHPNQKNNSDSNTPALHDPHAGNDRQMLYAKNRPISFQRSKNSLPHCQKLSNRKQISARHHSMAHEQPGKNRRPLSGERNHGLRVRSANPRAHNHI